MSERTEHQQMAATADLPVEWNVGESRFKYANNPCKRAGLTILQQRAKRLLLKNARRIRAGLPVIAEYHNI